MSSPLVSASGLAAALASARPPVVLDASLILHRPASDGEHRSESGYPLWALSHIPGSRHVDVATRFSDRGSPLHFTHPQPQRIADEAARLGVGRGSRVVVYDGTGTLWAARLWYLLRWVGVDVRVLDGGLGAWCAAGLPVASGDRAGEEPRPPEAAPPWRADVRRDFWVGLDELLGRAGADARPLVCGLAAASFAGTVPTRYSRRGHIPGSVNVPAASLFAADGTMRGGDDIAGAYAAAGVDVGPRAAEILLYCGGGIAASANALALAQAGTTAVRIYDGSLEEWTMDPGRHTVTA